VQALNPLPQQRKAAPPVASMPRNDNAASSAKWAERPVEKLSASAAYYEEEEDPELARYIWDRKAQKPRNEQARAAPKAMQAAQAPPLRSSAPTPQRQRQMLQQVMDMGFDELAAKRALASTGWSSVELAMATLFG